jgi:hypothetical protein
MGRIMFFAKIVSSFALLISIVSFNIILTSKDAVAKSYPKIDVNGNSRADMFLQNIYTGVISVRITEDQGSFRETSFGTINPISGWRIIGFKDFNGDGRTDLLWYNVKNGEYGVWLLNGSTIIQTSSYGKVDPQSGWVIIGLEDFNGDGRTDLLWYNQYNGELGVWLLNGSTIIQTFSYGRVDPKSGWVIIGLGDFNGDGRTDLLWYNQYNGEYGVWLLNGINILRTYSYGTVDPKSGWLTIGLGDFNGDGRTDLLWYNQFNNNYGAWLLNGGTIIQTSSYGKVDPKSGWSLIGVEDFNGDGRTDLLWYNIHNGEFLAWLIDGGRIRNGISYGRMDPKNGWSPIGFDDYNGNGHADLLWFNIFNNQVQSWSTDKNGVLQYTNYPNVPQSSVWKLEVPR